MAKLIIVHQSDQNDSEVLINPEHILWAREAGTEAQTHTMLTLTGDVGFASSESLADLIRLANN